MLDYSELDGIIGFFEAEVLFLYENNPHKYEIDADFFEGELMTTGTYFNELESHGKEDECINIRFGYHSKQDGTLCIAVYLPDLMKAPEIEQEKWFPFRVQKPLLSPEDQRFEMWYDRYLKGSFDVETGPRRRLARIIEKINACCKTLVCEPLYTAIPDKSVRYPISQNSHAYEDAHNILYGFLIDSLSKGCLLKLASLRNKTIHQAQEMRSTTLLRHVFNEFDKHSKLHTLLSKVSEQRGNARHGDRPPARKSDAFMYFYRDLEGAITAYEELLVLIESEFNLLSDFELERHRIMTGLPRIDENKTIESHYSICESTRMEGKTVEKVWYGMREDIERAHQSEVLYMQFTDGEILAVETGSNASDLKRNAAMKPDDFRVDLRLTWVPAPSNR